MMETIRRATAALAVVVMLGTTGCAAMPPEEESCRCDGDVPEGRLQTACGTTQCVGNVTYRCTGANAAVPEGRCGEPAPNPRPPGTPDLVFIAVSGHCLVGCPYSYNDEYLVTDGTIDALAQPFLDAGWAVSSFATTDNFHDQPNARGFLTLVQGMLDMREQYVADWDNPTRFIVVGHSHGAVWAHLALHVLEQWGVPLRVDALVDIDGLSLGWEDKVAFGFGDAWGPVIRAHMRDTGQTWPFDIANAADSWGIPGLSTLQDTEDVVPDSVLVNLEIWSSDATFPEPVRDSQPNHRLDGSEDNILWFRSTRNHERSDDADSDTVDWVRRELVALYQ